MLDFCSHGRHIAKLFRNEALQVPGIEPYTVPSSLQLKTLFPNKGEALAGAYPDDRNVRRGMRAMLAVLDHALETTHEQGTEEEARPLPAVVPTLPTANARNSEGQAVAALSGQRDETNQRSIFKGGRGSQRPATADVFCNGVF